MPPSYEPGLALRVLDFNTKDHMSLETNRARLWFNSSKRSRGKLSDAIEFVNLRFRVVLWGSDEEAQISNFRDRLCSVVSLEEEAVSSPLD